VISVGNLSVGGSGKTPVARWLARLLVDAGEKPSILSRGYARRNPADGVVVVHDGNVRRADLTRAGDEPMMLARSLSGVPVLVSPDRFLAGRLAERQFGTTVHILDDGFQHLALERDIDLLLVSSDDVSAPLVVPAGRLREPIDAASRADAVIGGASAEEAGDLARALGVARGFFLRRSLGPVRLVGCADREFTRDGARIVAVAGIARPERFFADLAAAGWDVAAALAFADHHAYTPADVARIARLAEAQGAGAVVTTEKDAVRLLPLRPLAARIAWASLDVGVEPAGEFRNWIVDRLRSRP
jgi:tetraacyldisaccharide 4'-kinase